MRNRQKIILFITGVVCLVLSPVLLSSNLYAEELGRLFLSKAERIKIDELRYAEPVEEEEETIEIVIEEIIEEEPEEFIPDLGDITVKGLVYRKGGNSTAWINDTNTFEGNLENQYINISSEHIDHEGIKLKIPKNETDIRLKVGETYDTDANEVKDLTEKYTR